MTDIYLYTDINLDSAKEFMQALAAANGDDVVIQECCPGGNVFAFWGMAAAMNDYKGKIKVKVQGLAASGGAFLLVYSNDSEALDVSTIMLHRADMYVSSPEDQAFLDKINADLQEKLTAKIDGKKLKELKGISIKDLFNPETRIDLYLTAKQAKDIGLINKVTKASPKEVAAFNEKYFQVAAEYTPAPPTKVNPIPNNKTMDITTLKAEQPALYNQVLELGIAAGIAKERDRVEAIMVYAEIDPKAAVAIVAEGKDLSMKQREEFAMKRFSPEALKKLAEDSAKPVTTGAATEVTLTEEDKKKAAAEAELDKILGLSK